MSVTVARIYDDELPAGARVLVDRLWPRGVSKRDAQLDDWCKELAPSDQLRRWYGHDPGRFDAFRDRYLEELHNDRARETLTGLAETARRDGLVLLTATKDVAQSQATVLAHVVRGLM